MTGWFQPPSGKEVPVKTYTRYCFKDREMPFASSANRLTIPDRGTEVCAFNIIAMMMMLNSCTTCTYNVIYPCLGQQVEQVKQLLTSVRLPYRIPPTIGKILFAIGFLFGWAAQVLDSDQSLLSAGFPWWICLLLHLIVELRKAAVNAL